jgi:hypothetical protein
MNSIDLCNIALLTLGIDPIQSLEDPTPQAIYLKVLYPWTKNRLLTGHPWSFAIQKKCYSFTFNPEQQCYTHSIPDDFLAFATQQPLKTNNRLWQSDVAHVWVSYISLVEESLWSFAFSQAFVDRLTASICFPLIQDKNLAQSYELQAQKSYAHAKSLEKLPHVFKKKIVSLF